MPIVTAIETWRKLSRWRHIRIAIQHVADFVRVLFLHAGEREISEALGSDGLKFRSVLRRPSDKRKQQERKNESLHL